jgi:hypothetical protein
VCRATSSVAERIPIRFSDFDLPSRCTASYLNGLKNKDILIPVYDDVTSWFGIGPRVRVYGYAVYHLVNYQLSYSGELTLYGYFSRGVQRSSGAGSVSLSPQG